MRREISEFIAYNNRLFGRIAPYYDGFEILIRNVRAEFVEFVDAPSAGRVLDIATGTGRQALAFARGGCLVTGIDLSPAMLARARKTAAHPRISWSLGLSSQLAFPDGVFDVAAVSFALHCMPLPVRQATVAEMVRVTKRRGRIAFVDYGVPANAVVRMAAIRFVELYETNLYREFIRSDFRSLLTANGLVIERQRSRFLGGVQMLVCRRAQPPSEE